MLTLLLAGCSTTPHTGTLSCEQATVLARKLANEQAQAQVQLPAVPRRPIRPVRSRTVGLA